MLTGSKNITLALGISLLLSVPSWADGILNVNVLPAGLPTRLVQIVCDGITDNAPALQGAINSLQSTNPVGGIIQLSSCNKVGIRSEILISGSNILITGAGGSGPTNLGYINQPIASSVLVGLPGFVGHSMVRFEPNNNSPGVKRGGLTNLVVECNMNVSVGVTTLSQKYGEFSFLTVAHCLDIMMDIGTTTNNVTDATRDHQHTRFYNILLDWRTNTNRAIGIVLRGGMNPGSDVSLDHFMDIRMQENALGGTGGSIGIDCVQADSNILENFGFGNNSINPVDILMEASNDHPTCRSNFMVNMGFSGGVANQANGQSVVSQGQEVGSNVPQANFFWGNTTKPNTFGITAAPTGSNAGVNSGAAEGNLPAYFISNFGDTNLAPPSKENLVINGSFMINQRIATRTIESAALTVVNGVNVGGSGYDTGTPATGTMTWSGGNCSQNPVLNVTTTGTGAIAAVNSVVTPGTCLTPPGVLAQTWIPSGGLAAGSGASFTVVAQGSLITPATTSYISDRWKNYQTISASSATPYYTGGAATATVGVGGTGYGASASGLIQWSGSNCTQNPALRVTTNSAGAITTVNSIAVAGSCTTYPSPSATTWTVVPGGGLTAGSGAQFTLNAGYGNATSGTVTGNGPGCQIPPVLNVTTDANGAINNVTSVATPGICTTLPNPITPSWLPGGNLKNGVNSSFTLTGTSTVANAISFNQKFSKVPLSASTSEQITTTSTRTLSATDMSQMCTNIEGADVADLGWPTNAAKPLTLSFWANAPVAGNYSLYLMNNTQSWSYIISAGFPVANSWFFFNLQIPPASGGAWSTDVNQIGIQLCLDLGAGLNYQTPTRGPVLSYGTQNSGSGYTPGTYFQIPLTGGTGFPPAQARLIADTNGLLRIDAITYAGIGYVAGEILTCTGACLTAIGGTGSGFSVPITSVTPGWSLGGFREHAGDVQLINQPVGSSFYITQVRLKKGQGNGPFSQPTYSEELRRAQRYLYALNEPALNSISPFMGYVTTTSVCMGSMRFPVTMMQAPSATLQFTGNALSTMTWSVQTPSVTTPLATPFFSTASRNGNDFASLYLTVPAGILTVGQPCLLVGQNGGSTVLWDADF